MADTADSAAERGSVSQPLSGNATSLPHFENVQIGVTDDGKPIVRPELRGRRIAQTPAEAQEDTLLHGDYFAVLPLLGEDDDE